MDDLRRSATCYIGLLTIVAAGLLVVGAPDLAAMDLRTIALALTLTGLSAITWLYPLPFAAKTKLYLYTSVLVSAVLLLEPGVAMAVAAIGAIAAHLIRREPIDQTLFNGAQATLQVAAASAILAVAGWQASDLHVGRIDNLIAVLLAGAAMHVVNTVAVAIVIGFQLGFSSLQVWYRSTFNFDRTEHLAQLSQVGIGLLAAVVTQASPWALGLLLLPGCAVYSSLDRHVKYRRHAEEALRGSEANLAVAQRIAHLGSWDWSTDQDGQVWSDEVYRIFGYEPNDIAPTRQAFLAAVHPDDRAFIERAIRGALATLQPLSVEHRIVLPDGAIRVVHEQAEVLTDGDGLALRLVGSIHDITERKALEEMLAHQAYHDPLTGLPNRALFTNRLELSLARASAPDRTTAVLFLDLDRFKVINDSLGHEVGDRLLIAVADRLQDCVRPTDTVARLGGDEFTMLLEDLTNPRDAHRIAERVCKVLEAPFTLGEQEIYVSTSIGIVFSGAGHVCPADLLRDADVALYRAKDNGKARYEVFESSMNPYTLTRVNLEADLRRAVERGEFVLQYQPKVELATGQAVGVEALVRWQHPQRGLVPPAEFIPLAEETGLILPIGRWVLEEACRQGRSWQVRSIGTPPVVSVNLSARQFQHPGLVEDVARVLRETELDPRRLKLEITESVVMGDAESNVVTLRRLKSLGVHVAIDDFGTGYSSLSYLKRFPVDSLKIDKSFIDGLGRDPEDTTIVQAVISLAHALGLGVVAEGVESAEQLRHLRAFGCELAQGYYFSRPLSREDADDLLMGVDRDIAAVNLRSLFFAPPIALAADAVNYGD